MRPSLQSVTLSFPIFPSAIDLCHLCRIFILLCNSFRDYSVCRFLQAGRRLWKAPLVSQLFPFLWAEPHHADVSLFCEDRSWQNNFSNSRSRITAWVARFLLKRSWRTVPVARHLTNVSVCFIQLSKSEKQYRLKVCI